MCIGSHHYAFTSRLPLLDVRSFERRVGIPKQHAQRLVQATYRRLTATVHAKFTKSLKIIFLSAGEALV